MRLFDVTELNRAENRRAQKSGLKLIVSYRGAQADTAKAEVREAGSTRVARTLKTLNAESVITPQRDARDIWQALTSKATHGAQRTTAAGIDRVWLDGVRRASLDKSVPQIGTPAAWKAGYTGKGVKIAVLDTGVDATHPDLKGQILDSKNFTASPDVKDRVGHGTHVSSIAASTPEPSRAASSRAWPRTPSCWKARCSTTTASATTPASWPAWSGRSRRVPTSST